MRVRDWMTPEPVTVSPHTSVLNARRLLAHYRVRHLPVVEEAGRLVGIISNGDLRVQEHPVLRTISALEWDLMVGRYRAVATLMRTPVVVTRPQERLQSAAARMVSRRIGALPVVEQGAVVGVLSLSDCVRALLDEETRQAEGPRLPVSRLRAAPGSRLRAGDSAATARGPAPR